jgi:hypothetical protein
LPNLLDDLVALVAKLQRSPNTSATAPGLNAIIAGLVIIAVPLLVILLVLGSSDPELFDFFTDNCGITLESTEEDTNDSKFATSYSMVFRQPSKKFSTLSFKKWNQLRDSSSHHILKGSYHPKTGGVPSFSSFKIPTTPKKDNVSGYNMFFKDANSEKESIAELSMPVVSQYGAATNASEYGDPFASQYGEIENGTIKTTQSKLEESGLLPIVQKNDQHSIYDYQGNGY